jgi:hypothetical protein
VVESQKPTAITFRITCAQHLLVLSPTSTVQPGSRAVTSSSTLSSSTLMTYTVQPGGRAVTSSSALSSSTLMTYTVQPGGRAVTSSIADCRLMKHISEATTIWTWSGVALPLLGARAEHISKGNRRRAKGKGALRAIPHPSSLMSSM